MTMSIDGGIPEPAGTQWQLVIDCEASNRWGRKVLGWERIACQPNCEALQGRASM